MKKFIIFLGVAAVLALIFTLPKSSQALDTVVVGQPYGYGGYGGYGPYGGGFYGGGFYGGLPFVGGYGGFAPYSPNPAMQNYVVGGNPLLLGGLSGYAGGPARQAQIQRAFTQTAPILLTPNPVDAGTYGGGFYPYAYPYPYYGGGYGGAYGGGSVSVY